MTTDACYSLDQMLSGVLHNALNGGRCRSCGSRTDDTIIGHDVFCPVPALTRAIARSADDRAALAQAQAERDAATEKALELQGAITILNNLCNMTVARAVQAENELKKDITDLLSKIGLLEWKLTRENKAGDDMARKLDGLVSERDAATRRAEAAEAVAARAVDALGKIGAQKYALRAAIIESHRILAAALAGPEGGPR